jgi:hypothetical protein
LIRKLRKLYSIARCKKHLLQLSVVFLLMLFINLPEAFAGPPFTTDDPEPVDYKHGEFYLGLQYRNSRDQVATTIPHIEFNYGLLPEMQVHLIAPLQYAKPEGQESHTGYGDTEVGVKYRFIKETDYMPQVGTFVMLELPTGDSALGLGNGKTQCFLPVWVQKSWGPWTGYGGGGYWINPGDGNRNWWQFGWVLQREINRILTLGAEIYYKTTSIENGDDSKGYTIGAIINVTDKHHLLISAGQDVSGPNYFSFYLAYQLTF